MRLQFGVLLILSLFFIQCDDDSSGSDDCSKENGKLMVDLGGNNWTSFSLSGSLFADNVALNFVGPDDSEIKIDIFGITAAGTYEIQPGNSNGVSLSPGTFSSDLSSTDYLVAQTGSIEVTSFNGSSRTISGSFDLVLEGSGKTMSASCGVFENISF